MCPAASFVPTPAANESNMAVMEVTLPSGFTVDRDALPSLEQSQHVRRVETKEQDTVVVLYFDKVGVNEITGAWGLRMRCTWSEQCTDAKSLLLPADGAQGVLPHGVGFPHPQGGPPAARARHRLRLLRPV